MKKFKLTLLLAITVMAPSIQAQESGLAALVEETGASWLIGHWEGTTDNGSKMHQNFSWDLNKNVINAHTKYPEWEIKGMIALNPESGEASYVGFSSRGGALRGVWSDHDGSPLLNLKARDQESRSWQGAVLYKEINDTTMEVQMFGLDDDGELKDDPQSTTSFKRAKK